MKLKTTFALACFLLVTTLTANQPQIKKATVYSIVKQRQSIEWYQAQATIWKKELEQNQENQEAWLNLYTAKRMLKIYEAGVSQDDLNALVKEIQKAIPNSFEYHYIAYWNGGIDSKDEMQSHLQKAMELGPERVELLDDLFTHYYLLRDKSNMEIVATKWFNSNDMSSGLYSWNYNMLVGLDEGAVVFTSGDNDTYPALVLQMAKGVRKDVVVFNASLLSVKSYRDLHFKELGLPLFEQEEKDYSNFLEYQKALVGHVKDNYRGPIYFAVSAQPQLYASFKEELYNVGLAYKWCENKFDNIAVTKYNFEHKYLLDYLKVDLDNDLSQGVVDHANANYLIPMLTLYNHYEESQDERAQEMEYLIDRIAAKNGMSTKVDQILEREENKAQSKVIDDPRTLEKGMVKIKDKLYASSTEVSNSDYYLFLNDMLLQRRFDELAQAKSDKVNWRKLDKEIEGLSDEELFPNGHPDSESFPVVNISYEAANLYCQWLTEVYNQSQHKRKTYSKVKFRLPSESEWEYMARGGLEKSAYPWGGPYARNAKGCFLGNWDVSDVKQPPIESGDCESCKRKDADGGFYTVPVTSYFPNGYGLYNMSGNVAEMIDQKGQVKGGSWNTPAGWATIVYKEEIESPSPEVGFRVVMEIIEE